MPAPIVARILMLMVRFLRFLVYAQAVLLGVALIAIAGNPSWYAQALAAADAYFGDEQRMAARALLAAAGSLVLFSVGALLVHWLHRHRFSREVTYHTEQGRIAVSLLAIEEALGRAVENEPSVRKVNIRVREDRVRRCIVIEASLVLWETDNVNEQNRRCQDILRQRFAELMPEKTAVQIELSVSRLRHRYDSDGFRPVPDPRRRTTQGYGSDAFEAKSSFTPGLAATRGQTDNHAGAALLARARHLPRQMVEAPELRTESGEPIGAEGAVVVQAVQRFQQDREPVDDLAARDASRRRYTDLARQGLEPPLEASASIPDRDQQRGSEPATTNTLSDHGEEVFDDLYFGPTYPVVEDGQEPDYSGSALPADKPPTRQIRRPAE